MYLSRKYYWKEFTLKGFTRPGLLEVTAPFIRKKPSFNSDKTEESDLYNNKYFNLYYIKVNVLCNFKTINNCIWLPSYFQDKIKVLDENYTNPIHIDLSFSPVIMEEWCLILTKVSNSSRVFNLMPSCFVKKLVISWLHRFRLLFFLYWLFKFPNLNKQNTNSLYPITPPATTLSHLLTSAKFLKSYLHGYSPFPHCSHVPTSNIIWLPALLTTPQNLLC